MGNVVEYAYPGDKLTYTAGGAITGGNLVKLTGDREVSQGTADSTAIAGVAMYDAASGAEVGVASKGVWPLVASGAINAGDHVVAAAAGKVKTVAAFTGTYVAAEMTTHERVIGIALEDIADTATGRVKLINLG